MIDVFIAIKQWFKTIRGKLTVWFVGSVVLVFTLFVVITAFVFWQILNAQVDHHIETVLNEVETIWHRNSVDRGELIESLVASQGMIVMIMAPDGEILLQTASADTSLPTQHQIQRHLVVLKKKETQTPHHFTINNTRFGLVTTPILPGQGMIGVGFSLSVLEETVRQSLLAIITLALVFIAILGLLGHMLAKKALGPVATITKTVKEITTSKDLKGRIPDPQSNDELGTLVGILNDMLIRLEESFSVQQQFFADAAHTLKTPLTAVRTQLENLQTDLGSNNQSVRNDVGGMIGTIDQVSRIVKDLLYLSKVSLPSFTNFIKRDFTEILEQVCEFSKALASEKDIRVTCTIETGLYVHGDKPLLLRGILNVVENAIHYTPKGGSISITAYRNKGQITVIIKDNGIGIPKTQLGHVFNRFFRGSNTKDRFFGTGLGLSITKAVIEGHRGKIYLQSIENEGTVIEIILPMMNT